MSKRTRSEELLPPQIPDTPRRLNFSMLQTLGSILLFAVPIAALLGVFGESQEDVSARSAALDIHLRHPSRMRYKLSDHLDLRIQNISDRTLHNVVVRIDESYLSGFSLVMYTPDARSPGEIVYPTLAAGEERSASIEIEAARYGTREGRVRVEADGREAVELPVSTFVFP